MSKYVDELNGFFQALRRLGRNTCDYWAVELDVPISLESSLDQHFSELQDIEVTNTQPATYQEVEALHEKFIFSRLETSDENVLKNLAWDLVEYYGLYSTHHNSEADFNPLVSTGALKISAESSFHRELVYYAVRYENQSILTGLGVRA